MKTLFRVFKGYWDCSKIENLIEKYQNKHHLEIKQVVVLRNDDDDFSVGVIFEKGSEYKEQLRNSKFMCNSITNLKLKDNK